MIHVLANLKHGFTSSWRPQDFSLSSEDVTYANRSECLEPGSFLSGARSNLLVLGTDSPVELSLVNGLDTRVVSVTSLYITDESWTTFTVTNLATSSDPANVTVFWSGASIL